MQDELLQSLGAYFDLMTHNGAAVVFHQSKALGIFESFQGGSKSAEDVARERGLKVEPCRRVLECLKEMTLLESDGEKYSPTLAMKFLSGQYADLGKEYWDHLPAFARSGEPIARMDSVEESENQYKKQVSSLDWMMRPSAIHVTEYLISSRKREGAAVLDLGAGSGVWSFMYVAQDPAARALLVDWNAVLDVARKSASELGIEAQVGYLPGNYHELRLPKREFDFAILGNVTHIETEDGLHDLLTRAKECLKPGGEIVILDLLPTDAKGKLGASLYTLGLALRTEKGRVYSLEELKKACTRAGLEFTEFYPVPVTPFTMGMVTARRP
ncbi:MAG TPA: class I SAM-dependent methyltransferase [Bdellovibrionota bacterium]|nr:class I SAM-dependent methyltransferase [Bdellovibrionota bacterium]